MRPHWVTHWPLDQEPPLPHTISCFLSPSLLGSKRDWRANLYYPRCRTHHIPPLYLQSHTLNPHSLSSSFPSATFRNPPVPLALPRSFLLFSLSFSDSEPVTLCKISNPDFGTPYNATNRALQMIDHQVYTCSICLSRFYSLFRFTRFSLRPSATSQASIFLSPCVFLTSNLGRWRYLGKEMYSA